MKVGKYLVENVTNPRTGANMSMVRVPLSDFTTPYISPQKIKIRDRIANWFRTQAVETTSLAKDERTTEMGATAEVGDLGIGTAFYEKTRLEQIRRAKYRDFDHMDRESTVMSRALDVTTSNMFVSRDGDQESYVVKSEDQRVQNIIDDLDRRVDMPGEIQGIARVGMHYGDDFEELVYDGQRRLIMRIKWLNPYYMERIEDEYGRIDATRAFIQTSDVAGASDIGGVGTNIGDVSMSSDMGWTIAAFHFWQIVHTRYNHRRGNIYGTSFFNAARRPFKLLQVMEDGVAINRISRATDKYVFYIEVPKGAQLEERQIIMDDAKRRFRKRFDVDADGKLNLSTAPYGDSEDFFIGVEPDGRGRVETLKGSTIIGQLGDVEYFQNLEAMATGVPKSYLQLERDVTAQATLNNEDLEFARMLRSHQKKIAWFQRQVYDRQLIALGIPLEADQYTVEYPSISFVDEKLKQEVNNIKWGIAAIAKQQFGIPTTWILKEIVGLDEDAIGEIEAGLQEPLPQQPGFVQPPSGQEIPAGERARVREQVFQNRRLQTQLGDIRDLLTMVAQSGVGKTLVA